MDRKSSGGSRKKRVSGGPAAGGGVYRRGKAVKTPGDKPVGKSDGYAERKQASNATIGSQQNVVQYGNGSSGGFNKPPNSQRQKPTGGGGISPKKLLILISFIVIGYLLLRSCSGIISEPEMPVSQGFTADTPGASVVSGNLANNDISPMTGITGPRTRRTEIIGGGRDIFTIMIYMCGTDLESQYGMGTADLNEMLHASISNQVNVIVETGGTARWQNSVVKNNTNQRYQVTSAGLRLLQDNLGRRPMTDPNTLEDFISYAAANFPANRYALIFWDHGGGSLSGFGYDQLFPNSGSMTISQIHSALEGAGVKFDFIGFDACLMATLETAYMLNYHADYMIASEETEPGIGWYYTNWISKLSANTSMDTVDIGKLIIDDFISTCRKIVPREITTLSIIDLVALNNIVDDPFKQFATSIDEQLNSDYMIVSNARGDSREFNRSRLDQVDLIDLAQNIGSPEALALVGALQQAIKYNRTSENISKAHGVSIYFPYDELRNISSMVNIYDQIGMSGEYTMLIKKFANMVVGGQITTSGSNNPLESLLGQFNSGSSSVSSADLWSLAWNTFFADADYGSVIGALPGEQADWIDPNLIQSNADYYREHYLNAGNLQLTRKGSGYVIKLTDEQWGLIQKVELNVFFDDGAGFIDLGLDNIYEFDSDGDLIVNFDGTWLALDRHIVSYYVESIEEDGSYWSITGRIPAMLNNELVDIIVMFNNSYPYGTVAGARINYGALTDTAPKGLISIKKGDLIDFLCDYYTYDGEYDSSYYLGDQMVVDGELEVSNVHVGSARCMVTYRLTDIYNNTYWTPALLYQN